jgi:hypothetical protein
MAGPTEDIGEQLAATGSFGEPGGDAALWLPLSMTKGLQERARDAAAITTAEQEGEQPERES